MNRFLLISFLCVCGMLLYLKNNPNTVPKSYTKNYSQNETAYEDTDPKEDTVYNPTFKKNKPKLEKENFNFEGQVYHDKEKSDQILEEYSKKMYVDINGFDDFIFEDHSEEKVAMLVGKNEEGTTLIILGAEQIPAREDVIQLLKENGDELPDVDFQNLLQTDFNKITTLTEDRGFSDSDFWYGEKNGAGYGLLFAPRSDGKGSYAIFVNGDAETLKSKEEYYEELIENIRTRPVNK